MIRNSFVFYEDWAVATADLPNDVRLEVYDGIIQYALSGKLPQLRSIAGVAFNFIKPQIDRNNQRFQNGCKGSVYGKFGGRPAKNETPPKPQNNPKITPPKPLYENENENENENEKKRLGDVAVPVPPEIENRSVETIPPHGTKARGAARFVPPTLAEVTAYCAERGGVVDPQQWLDYYMANGWRVGKNAMKDWRAAVRTWEKNGYSKKPASIDRVSHPAANYDNNKTFEKF